MHKAVIFDVDETLLDHSGAQRDTLNDFYQKHDRVKKLDQEEFIKLWAEESEKSMQRFLSGELSFEKQRVERVKIIFRQLGEELADKAAHKLFQEFLAQYRGNIRVFDDVVPCLESLSKYKLGIVSNGDSSEQRYKLNKTGLAPYFSSIVVSGDINIAKPSPEIFQTSLKELDVCANEALYIGDSLGIDVRGAQGAGLDALWLVRDSRATEGAVNSTTVINSLAEIRELVSSY